MRNFKASTVLITGASSGIGREMALQLAPEAARLILAARRLDRLEALKAEILLRHPTVEIFPYQIDLADGVAVENFLNWIAENHSSINFLINNAGVGDHGFFVDGDWARVEKMIAVNISALTKITHGVLPQMLRNGDGAILNVSSVASLLPVPLLNVYAATKAYVTSFSEGLRAELRGTNVSVTVLCPGPVPTEFGQQATRQDEADPLKLSTPDLVVVDVETVARAGLNAVRNDRARSVPGLAMLIAATALTLLPIILVRPFLNRYAINKMKKP